MLFLIGAKKVGAVFVPEGGVVKDGSGNFVPGGIHEPRMIRHEPTVERNLPHLIRGLRHFHVAGVRGEIHRADAERDGMRGSVHFCL